MQHRRIAVTLLLLTALVAGGIVWWRDEGKRLYFPRNWGEVEPGLYRSGQIHRRLIEDVLREQRIDVVIDLARDRWNDEDDRVEREATARLGIALISLRGLRGDGGGDPGDYVEALAALARAQREGQRVLVHCRGGSERTGNFFLLYRTLFHGWSASDALAEYARYRNKPLWQTSSGAYLDAHVAGIAAALVERGALASVPAPLPVFGPAVAAAAGP